MILLILLLVMRLGGRRQEPAANPELDNRIAPPTTPATDAEASPPEREIYRPQPTPFASQPPAAAAEPAVSQPPPDEPAYSPPPEPAAPPAAPTPQPVPFPPMPTATSPAYPSPESTSPPPAGEPAGEPTTLVPEEPVTPIERITRAAPMYEPPPESDAPPIYTPPVDSPAYPTIVVPWATTGAPADSAADSPPAAEPASPYAFPSSREDEPPWTPAQAEPGPTEPERAPVEPEPAVDTEPESATNAEPESATTTEPDADIPFVVSPEPPPIERPAAAYTAFPSYTPPEPEPPVGASEAEPSVAASELEPPMATPEVKPPTPTPEPETAVAPAGSEPSAPASAPGIPEAHYVAPEPLMADLPPTRIPIPQATMDAVDAAPAQAEEPVAEVAPAPAAGEGALILLIEDDERIAKFYSILFEAKGYAVQNARDGVEGVDMATNLNPALILLDVMMPKMNGLMVLQTLRANPETEHTPVVVLSNYMEPPLIQRALQLGAIEYVVKSQARPEQLVNAVPSWLQGEPALH